MTAVATSSTGLPTRGALLLAQALTQPMALLPSFREQLLEIVARHARGETADFAAIEAKLGRPLANEPQGYQVVDGIAVVPVSGVLAPKMNMLMQISGGTSTQMLESDVRTAGADPNVRGIVLAIDSPGGSVLGTPEAGQTIRDVAAAKPVVAHTDGLMASAGYWIGSAANAVFLSGSTVQVGSIGVAATHTDRSLADQDAGVKRTEITAGKFKRIASDTGPLTAEGAQTMQDQVDYLYSLFVETVASNRGASVADVLSGMADGRIFIGQQALDAGLADGFSSLGGLVQAMAANPSDFARRRTGRGGTTTKTPAAPTRAPAVASAGAPAMPTRQHTEADAVAYSQRHGVRLATARTALNVQAPAGGDQRSRADVAAEASAFATQHRVDYVTAVKAIGGDPGTAPREAAILRRMAETRCDRIAAAKALARNA